MFTGIVREVGRIASIREGDDARRLEVEAPALADRLEAGDSVSVDGACLTVVEGAASGFAAEVIGTTLSRTLAREYREGDRVNLEPALRVGDGLDGHFVQGHVDGLGEVVARREEGEHRLLAVRVPREVWETTVLHGSISLNGVSLTVNALAEPDSVEVALIPYTREHTNLGELEPGDPVNVEGDLLGKYVGRIVGREGPNGADEARAGPERDSGLEPEP